MSLSSFCVVSNALRLRLFKPKAAAETKTPVNTRLTSAETAEKEEIPMKKVLTVNGMMCAHCKARVETALSALEGVASCAVDLEAKTAACTLSAPVEDQALADAVTNAGYEVISVQ